MPRRNELVDIEADLVHETDLAYLISPDGRKKEWVPKSAVEYDKDEGIFTMPLRLAEEKGFV